MSALVELAEAVIERGIKRPIEMLLQQKSLPAALILTYSGIDTMAFLNMPAEKTNVMRSDFIAWAEHYIRLPHAPDVTGRDLYGARCSVLHGGAQSRFTREGRGRMIVYATPSSADPALIVPAEELVQAFFFGAQRFLADLAGDARKTNLAERRLRELREGLPYR